MSDGLKMHEYCIEQLKKIIPHEFETKEESIRLLKLELAKMKIFDIEELTYNELITAVCVSKGIKEHEILTSDFNKFGKVFSIFQHISPDDTIKYLDLVKDRYVFDNLEKLVEQKYGAKWTTLGNKIKFQKGKGDVFTLFRPYVMQGLVVFEKVFFNLIKSEEELQLMPEELLATKTPKFVTSIDSNKKYMAQVINISLEEMIWIVDNIDFITDGKTKKVGRGKQPATNSRRKTR